MSNEPVSVQLGEQDWLYVLRLLEWHTHINGSAPEQAVQRIIWDIGRARLEYIADEIRTQSAVTEGDQVRCT